MKKIKMFNKTYNMITEPKYYEAYQMKMVLIEIDGERTFVPTPKKYEITLDND